jgi:hypothetical protein
MSGALEAQNGAVDFHNGGVKAQNGALEGLLPVVADSHHFDQEKDANPYFFKVKSRIRIHI